MFGAHWPEIVILLVLALLVFGPKRLPEIGGSLGKGIKEFRKATSPEDDKPELSPPSRDVHIPDPTVQSAATTDRPAESASADQNRTAT